MKILEIDHTNIDRNTCINAKLQINKILNKKHNHLLVFSKSKKQDKLPNVLCFKTIQKDWVSIIQFNLYNSLFLFKKLFEQIDIVILEPFTLVSVIPYFLISKLLFRNTKFVLNIRSPPVNIGFSGFLDRINYSLAMRFGKYFFDGIGFLTKRMAQEECKKFKITNKKIGVWTSGVNEELFNPTEYIKEGKLLRKRLMLEDKFILFYHGVLSSNRGLQSVITALNLVKKEYPNIFLFLLGNGVAKKELISLIKKNKLEKNVVIYNSVAQKKVPKYIAIADAAIVPLPNHPNWNNQSPIKVMEYLAMEKPIILTDIPAHKDIIGKEKCGIFIKSHEPKEIANEIIKAYKDKRNLKKIGKEGRKIVLKNYTWNKITKDLEMFLIKVKNETN